MPLKIRDLMVRDIITVSPKETVLKAVELRNRQEIECLVVVENEAPVGIVTERDILGRVVLGSKNPVRTKVSEIMTRSFVVESQIWKLLMPRGSCLNEV